MHLGMTHVCVYAAPGRCCPPKWHHVTDYINEMGGDGNVGSNDLDFYRPQLRWLVTGTLHPDRCFSGHDGGRNSVSNNGGGESNASASFSAASHVAFQCFLPMFSDVSGIMTVITSEEMQ